MAVSTTYTSGFGTAGGQREGLSDVLSVLEPTDLYLWNRLGHQNVESTYPEWQTYDLASAAQNGALEGGDFSEDSLTAPVRKGNYTRFWCTIERLIVEKILTNCWELRVS